LQDLQALLQTLQHHSTIQPATHDALPSEPLAETLMVRHGGKILTIRTREIAWIEAADDYAVLHVIRQSETAPQTAHQTTQYLASTNLSALEQRLPAQLFKRVHRSTVLNISFIRHLEADPSGSMTATMLNGSKLKVSRSYAPALKKLLV
jgi:two-component system LytT family response regulator